MPRANRSKGSGTLYRKNEVYYLRYMVAGKRKAKCLHVSTRAEAEKEADKVLPKSLRFAESKAEIAVHIAEAKRFITDSKALPIKSAWSAFETCPERGDCKAATLTWYESIWARFEEWISANHPEIKTLRDVDRALAAEYANNLWASGISATTFNHQLVCLRTICNALAVQASLSEIPFRHIEKKRTEKKERLGFTLADIDSIMAVFKDPDFNVLNKAELEILFGIGIYTGMRLGDCCLLKWESVDFPKNLITVVPQKTSRIHRTVRIPILPQLRSVLDSAKVWKNALGFVLPKMADRYKRNVYGIVHDYSAVLDKAGFNAINKGAKRKDGKILEGRGTNRRKYGFHSFRHTFASICAASGVPITTLSEILGDNVSTLQAYYLHPSEEMREKVAGALQPKALPAPEETSLSPEAKLEAIADIVSKGKPSKELKAILKILRN